VREGLVKQRIVRGHVLDILGRGKRQVNEDEVRGCNVLTPQSRGKGSDSAIPFTTARGTHVFGLRVGQSTVMRVAAVVPLITCTGVPTPT
jgi:hypothetical protein